MYTEETLKELSHGFIGFYLCCGPGDAIPGVEINYHLDILLLSGRRFKWSDSIQYNMTEGARGFVV